MQPSPINCLHIYPQFLTVAESEELFEQLCQHHAWPDNHYQFKGREFVLPRQQTWHADEGVEYSYSNNLLQTRPWTPSLLNIRHKIEAFTQHQFNAVLVNLYRTGDDYVGWHADDEPELGAQPYIASLTLGQTRTFAFKHKRSGETKQLDLESGSLLLMEPAFQHDWLHSVPVDKKVMNSRINLTFRHVLTKVQFLSAK